MILNGDAIEGLVVNAGPQTFILFVHKEEAGGSWAGRWSDVALFQSRLNASVVFYLAMEIE